MIRLMLFNPASCQVVSVATDTIINAMGEASVVPVHAWDEERARDFRHDYLIERLTLNQN